MAAVRKVHQRTTLVTGQRNPLGQKGRVCPKCDAKLGHSCQRWINHSARYGGGGYWKQLTHCHRER